MTLASESSLYKNQISALPAPPLLIKSSDGEPKTGNSLEPNYFLPQLTPDTVEVSARTESQIADKSQQHVLYDDLYNDSYDDSYDESYDDSYNDSYDAPAASVADSSVAQSSMVNFSVSVNPLVLNPLV